MNDRKVKGFQKPTLRRKERKVVNSFHEIRNRSIVQKQFETSED